MSDKHVEIRAYIFSTALVVILGVVVAQFLFPALFPTKKDMLEDFSVFETSIKQEDLEVDDAATIGQKFIKQLAFYSEMQDAPILLESSEEIDHNNFLSTYSLASEELLYSIEVEVLSGHVIGHRVNVENLNKTVKVSEPEPLSVNAANRLVVKGMIKEINPTTVALFTATGELAKQQPVNQLDEETFVFSHSLPVSDLAPGMYFLEVKSIEEKVVFPVILASSV